MQSKTSGIILRTIRYSDKSSIATIYTREYGRISYMVYGLSGKKSNGKAAFSFPLSIIEVNASFHPGKEIQQLKDIRIEYPFTGITCDPVKNAIALFLAELLMKTLRQPDPDPDLFDFLEHSIRQLDRMTEGVADFHLVFMTRLTRYLGFEPNHEDGGAYYLDLQNGLFTNSRPIHAHFISGEAARTFLQLLMTDDKNPGIPVMSREKRISLLETLTEYYKLHVPDFHGLNSTAVLHEIFN